MNSEAVWTSRIAFLFLTVLLTISGVARGDGDALKIRWDIQHYPNFVLQPGGEAFADAADSSKIRLTGSGTFKTDGDDVTGGGTWETFAASGTRTGSGSYRVLKLVSWYVAPGALPCPPITDEIASCADARAGLAVLRIQYSGGGVGKLVVSCRLPVGSSLSTYEGITVSMGFVDYYLPENPDLTMNEMGPFSMSSGETATSSDLLRTRSGGASGTPSDHVIEALASDRSDDACGTEK